MESHTTHPRFQDAPFGYRILHASSTGGSEPPVVSQGHLRRVAGPQSSCIKEVPSLENVSAFLSDPLNVEDDASATSRVRVPGEPAVTGEACSEELIDDFDPTKILRLVDRTLSSAWKFNPYLGASPGCMDPLPPDLELTSDEHEFANGKKIIKDTANATRLRADTARGLFELQIINKRNKKNLSITPWPEDILFLNDKAFAEQVNLNAFHSRDSIPNNVSNGVRDTRADVCHKSRQAVFKDSAIYMEDGFEKEATKGSPTSSTPPEHERNEEAVTGSFIAPSLDEVDCESPISSEFLQELGHSASDAAGFGTISAADINTHAELEGESVQTSLALFDSADASFDGQYDGPPCNVRDLVESSTVERAMENTLFLDDLDLGTMPGHSLQHEQQEIVENDLPSTDTAFMGMLGGASLKTEEHVAPFPAPDMISGPFDQAVSNYMNNTYGAETPLAPPSPPFGSFNLLAQRELTPPNALSDVHNWSTPSTDHSAHYNVPTPIGFASPSPPPVLQASNVPHDNEFEGSNEVFSAPAPVHQASPTDPEVEASLKAAGVYFHNNGPFSAPTPMYPIPVLPGQATDAANAFNVHTPNDSDALYAPTPMVPEFFSPDAATEVVNAAENFSYGITEGHFADYGYPEPPSSASRQLFQDLDAAANGNTTANGEQSPIAPVWAPTPMGLDDSIHDQFDFEHGYLPATDRSAISYRSPYPSMSVDSVEDGNRLHNDPRAPSPVINAYGRPSYGALRLPGYPAVARSDTNSSMEDNPPLSPRDGAQNTALSEYIRANTIQPSLSHVDSNMSMEVHTGAATEMGPRSPKPNDAANANFAAGARGLASSIARPSTPKNPSAPPYSISPVGAALHLTMPLERQRPDRAGTNWGAPIPIPGSGASVMRPHIPRSPYDDAPAFSTRKRTASAASAASGASAGTSVAPSGDEADASPETNTSKAKTPRRKKNNEAKAPRRKSTPKVKSRSATPAAGKSGGRGRAQSVRTSQEGQPPKMRGRPRKKAKNDAAGLA